MVLTSSDRKKVKRKAQWKAWRRKKNICNNVKSRIVERTRWIFKVIGKDPITGEQDIITKGKRTIKVRVPRHRKEEPVSAHELRLAKKPVDKKGA